LYVDDPDEGYDVTISREGQGERTRYSVKIARHPSAVELRDECIDLLEENPLPDTLIFFDYDYIAKVFSGKSAETTKANAEPKKAKKPEPPTWSEVEEADFDELAALCEVFELCDDPNELDEEDLRTLLVDEFKLQAPRKAAKPAARPTRKSEPVKEEAEEEEEEAEEEEEEEEAPKKPSVRDRLRQIRGKE